MTKQTKKSFIEAFNKQECTRCGLCLYKCRYQNLTIEESKKGINNLINDVDSQLYMNKCVLCSKCNEYCPIDAKPMALRLHYIEDRRKKEKKLPKPISYMINGIEGKEWKHNFFRDIYRSHSKEEKKILNTWASLKNGNDILWCGCASRLFPYDIENSKALSDLPKFGGQYDCCGNPTVKSGLFEEARLIATNLLDKLSKMKFKRLVSICGTCQETFLSYFPNYFGIDFPFKVISIYEYLDEQIQSGKLVIQRKYNLKASLSLSCFNSAIGGDFNTTINRLCNAIGIKTVDLKYNACCGINAFTKNGKFKDIVQASQYKVHDIRESNTNNVLTYCYGCNMTIRSLQSFSRTHFLLEMILWALGDDIKYPTYKLSKKLLNRHSILNFLIIIPPALSK